jgi:hypothetical protein
MRRRHLLGILLLSACKAELGNGARGEIDASEQPADGPQSQGDAAVDMMVMLGPWGTPVAIPGANSALGEDDATLSSNKLEMYFKRTDAGPDNNLYVMTRASETAAWSTPAAVTALDTTAAEESPRLSSNDLTMYFGRAGQIYKSVRTSTTTAWQAPTLVASLNTTANEKWADVCDNGYAIVSRLVTGQGQELFEGTITAGATTALTALNSASNEQGTLLTADCLHLYFQSDRAGTFDIYTSSRTSVTGAWSAPTLLVDFNTTTLNEEDPWISTDQRTFVFVNNASGNKDVYISTR